MKYTLRAVAKSYIIAAPPGVEPLYSHKVCGMLEHFLPQLHCPYSYSYCNFAENQGVMTVTILEKPFTPTIITFFYEKELNTYAE